MKKRPLSKRPCTSTPRMVCSSISGRVSGRNGASLIGDAARSGVGTRGRSSAVQPRREMEEDRRGEREGVQPVEHRAHADDAGVPVARAQALLDGGQHHRAEETRTRDDERHPAGFRYAQSIRLFHRLCCSDHFRNGIEFICT